MQRSERQEQMARAGKESLEVRLNKAERRAKRREIEAVPEVRPRRVARPGKPLKR